MGKSGQKRHRAKQGVQQSALTKKKLIQFFVKTAELQRKLEIIKQMLAEELQFTPASLFHRLDKGRKKFISQKDIEEFLIQSNIQFKGSELKTLFGRIDVNQNQMITLREFQNFILPNQNPRLRYETVRRPVIIPYPNQKLTEKIQWITTKFFTQIITQYTKLMEYNNALVSSFDFNIENIFDLLSKDGQTIKAEDIERFMQINNIKMATEQLGCIIKLIDKKGQGHLYRDDFKVYLATLGLKKEHEIFDELSPIPALKQTHNKQIAINIKDRQKTLKERYKDNKSYVKGMDVQGHHIMGYSRVVDEASRLPAWIGSRGSDKKRFGGDG